MINPAKKQNPLDNPVERANRVNDPQFTNSQGYSIYNLDHTVNQTLRYGEVIPNVVFDAVSGDRHLINVSSKTIANQLQSPLMSEVNLHTGVFAVPYLAMYPNNWAKIIANPLKGDDVPPQALPAFPLLWYLRQHLQGFTYESEPGTVKTFTWTSVTSGNFNYAVNLIMRVLFILSKGQLLDSLGYSFDYRGRQSSGDNFLTLILGADYNRYNNVFSAVVSKFFDQLTSLNVIVPTGVYEYLDYPTGSNYGYLGIGAGDSSTVPYLTKIEYPFLNGPVSTYTLSDVRQLLYDALQNGYFVTFAPVDSSVDLIDAFSDLGADLTQYYNYLSDALALGVNLPVIPNATAPDLSRVLAYNMTVAEFMSADGVDDIFSSELYMQNLRAIMYPSVNGKSTEPTFEYNGVSTEYDYFTIGAIGSAFALGTSNLPIRLVQMDASCFVLQNSLRYRDFFASARTSPLAVGDVTINISNNQVSAVEVTQNLLMQRFLNAVNRVKNKLADYMTGIFGIRPTIEAPAPLYVTQFTESLGGTSVVNTADDQGKVTSNIESANGNQSNVDLYLDDFYVVMSLRWLEGLPSYVNSSDPAFFLHDRFERFNAMLQHIGDEPIPGSLLLSRPVVNDSTFGYTSRYSAYKFAVSRSQGGFVDDLDGYVFQLPTSYLDQHMSINPEFIREKQYFFDQFFASLTGVSPAQYFHFISSTVVEHTAARKMEYLPPTLF